MKNRIVKLACVFLTLTLILTGCSLIAIDPVMQADEDFEALVKEYSKPLVTYDGGVITKGDIMNDYYYNYSYMSYMYSMYGYTFDESQATALVEDVTEAQMNTRALLLKADELGIALTNEEKTECATAAQESYDSSYKTILENAEGDTAELKDKNAKYEAYAEGNTIEMLTRQQEWTKLVEKVQEAVKAEVTEISEEDLELKLTEQSIADEETYSGDLKTFESDMMDETKVITWMPEGYRTVKHILVKVDEETLSAVTTARTAYDVAQTELDNLNSEFAALSAAITEDAAADETEAEAEPTAEPRAEADILADISAKESELVTLKATKDEAEMACIASVQTKLDEIYAKLDAGEKFEDVMAEYGEDPGMQSEPTMTTGYCVSAVSESWDVNFRDEAMALQNVGDYSASPIIGTSGVHIVYYNSDIVAGQVQLADIHDKFYDKALESEREDYITEKTEEWVSLLNPVYTLDDF